MDAVGERPGDGKGPVAAGIGGEGAEKRGPFVDLHDGAWFGGSVDDRCSIRRDVVGQRCRVRQWVKRRGKRDDRRSAVDHQGEGGRSGRDVAGHVGGRCGDWMGSIAQRGGRGEQPIPGAVRGSRAEQCGAVIHTNDRERLGRTRDDGHVYIGDGVRR